MILWEGMRLVVIGVAAGGAVALAAAGSVGSMLFLKNPRDVLTFTLVPGDAGRGGRDRVLDSGDSRHEYRPLGGAARRVAAAGCIMNDMATTTLMSFAEFELLDAGADDVELLRGELIRVPPPQRKHMEICERLFELLKAALERRKRANAEARIGRLHIEMGYKVSTDPQSWLRPDLSLTHPDQPGERYYEGAPLVAFEVVSESRTISPTAPPRCG